METSGRLILLFVLVTAIFGSSDAQSVCNVPYSGLFACLPAARPPNPPPPTAACCNTVRRANLGCLCSYMKSKALSNYGVDPNLAIQIPTKCGIPNAGHC
ncbi:hypothetical protein SAY86_018238 [Trapa natans]|uniref:Bifunctional inhibitor/plant lipid transfer protein/seed storage helical domain-containing protein n=1 Tax=Trapa natans TaxID=22666 RepID=A0AAN7LER5_TRANT|nr:hypothetical protein SAY86_018238 [Trapa natans]